MPLLQSQVVFLLSPRPAHWPMAVRPLGRFKSLNGDGALDDGRDTDTSSECPRRRRGGACLPEVRPQPLQATGGLGGPGGSADVAADGVYRPAKHTRTPVWPRLARCVFCRLFEVGPARPWPGLCPVGGGRRQVEKEVNGARN